MSDVTKVGTTIGENEQRDAIHIAVAPCRAAYGETLYPGQHVGFRQMGETEVVSGRAAKKIGIVDPFLTHSVPEQTRFWVFLYPNTITALRHQWEHPAFGPRAVAPPSESKDWLETFAASHSETYENLIEAAQRWIKDNEYYYGDRQWDGHSGKFEGIRVPDQFWEHYEKVFGKVAPEQRENFFTCSC